MVVPHGFHGSGNGGQANPTTGGGGGLWFAARAATYDPVMTGFRVLSRRSPRRQGCLDQGENPIPVVPEVPARDGEYRPANAVECVPLRAIAGQMGSGVKLDPVVLGCDLVFWPGEIKSVTTTVSTDDLKLRDRRRQASS